MLFETPNLAVTAEYGTATLWLRFPGEPANALDLDRLREIDAAIQTIEANPALRVLVLRSENPVAFCTGLRPEAVGSLTTAIDAAAFSWFGQRVMNRLANLNAVSVAFVQGACLNAGLELALACDYRLAVANIAAPLGFPNSPGGAGPCLGGSVRLQRLLGRIASRSVLEKNGTFSAREAKRLGFVDHAFCERRARIELRSFLDKLERHAYKPRRHPRGGEAGFTAERQAFAQAFRGDRFPPSQEDSPRPATRNPVPPPPTTVGYISDAPALQRLAAEQAMRGTRVLIYGAATETIHRIERARQHGFLTPLEADQACGRIVVVQTPEAFREADLVFVPSAASAAVLAPTVRPRTVLAFDGPPSEVLQAIALPRRVLGVHPAGEREVHLIPTTLTDADTVAALSAWLSPLGVRVRRMPASSISRALAPATPAPSSFDPVAA